MVKAGRKQPSEDDVSSMLALELAVILAPHVDRDLARELGGRMAVLARDRLKNFYSSSDEP